MGDTIGEKRGMVGERDGRDKQVGDNKLRREGEICSPQKKEHACSGMYHTNSLSSDKRQKKSYLGLWHNVQDSNIL